MNSAHVSILAAAEVKREATQPSDIPSSQLSRSGDIKDSSQVSVSAEVPTTETSLPPSDVPRKPPQSVRLQDLPAHSFPPTGAAPEDLADEIVSDDPLDRNADLWMYRKRTIVLLHRYLRYSLETGRVPSILGCEFFRSSVTSYSVTTFEDRVLFVHDVEVCLNKLDEFSRHVIARVILEEHSHGAAARLLHCSRRKLERELFCSLDRLSELFLGVGLLVENSTTLENQMGNQELENQEEFREDE